MLDWSRPLVAVDLKSGNHVGAEIDRTFAKRPSGQFVRLSRNAWTGDGTGGTWAFDDDGLASAGKSPDGYNGRFRLENGA